jgi:hypothetical protein
MVIINEREPFFFFKGSDSGLLCKNFQLFGLDEIIRFVKGDMNLRAYDDRKKLVRITARIYLHMEYTCKSLMSGKTFTHI